MSRRVAARLVAAIALCLSMACGVNGLSFVTDERIEIVSPRDRSKVTLPIQMRWTVSDFSVTGPTPSARPDAGYFGIFLDRAPQPPGETFRWFAKDDSQCEVTPGCPDATYYASKNVYATMRTEFTIDRLPETRREDARRYRDLHELVVVLLDGRGRRIGESAFRVEFELDRSER